MKMALTVTAWVVSNVFMVSLGRKCIHTGKDKVLPRTGHEDPEGE